MMLLTVLLISGGILSITSITAYLMAQRLHLASNINDSTKAIYAADAGIEWSLYKSSKPAEARNHPWSQSSIQTLNNGAQFAAKNPILYVESSIMLNWLTPRCGCDAQSDFRDCGQSFMSEELHPGNICYDHFCTMPGMCGFFAFLGTRRSTQYTGSATNITSIGKSGDVVRAFELSL